MLNDFEKIVDRTSSNSLKWDVPDGTLPMWVADMDFMTAEPVLEAIRKRASIGIFGYSVIPDTWYEAYISWWKERHNVDFRKEQLIFCTGVVPAVSSSVRRITAPGDNIVVLSPVYNIFYNSIINNSRRVLECPLEFSENSYSINFSDLEKKLSGNMTTAMILCNPHNPVGKIWDRDTLSIIGELCSDNGVTVISDEIHCDLTDPGKAYIPFASVSEKCRMNSITCMSPSKAFNLAGLQSAAVAVPNPDLYRRIERAFNTDEIAEPNAFAVDSAIAAFNEGASWLDDLRKYIFSNKKYVSEYISSEIPEIRVCPSEATYLVWIDCRSLGKKGISFSEHLRKNAGLLISDGAVYGTGGEGFIRVNIACPASQVRKGMEKLKYGVNSY